MDTVRSQAQAVEANHQRRDDAFPLPLSLARICIHASSLSSPPEVVPGVGVRLAPRRFAPESRTRAEVLRVPSRSSELEGSVGLGRFLLPCPRESLLCTIGSVFTSSGPGSAAPVPRQGRSRGRRRLDAQCESRTHRGCKSRCCRARLAGRGSLGPRPGAAVDWQGCLRAAGPRMRGLFAWQGIDAGACSRMARAARSFASRHISRGGRDTCPVRTRALRRA